MIIILASLLNHAVAAENVSSKEAVETEIEITPSTNSVETNGRAIDNADFCFFADVPQAGIEYTIVRKVAVKKGTYGGDLPGDFRTS